MARTPRSGGSKKILQSILKRRKGLKNKKVSILKNRHKVHCVVSADNEAFTKDRSTYDEQVITVPNASPGPSYASSMRVIFRKNKISTQTVDVGTQLVQLTPKTFSKSTQIGFPNLEKSTQTGSPKLGLRKPEVVAYIDQKPSPKLEFRNLEVIEYIDKKTLEFRKPEVVSIFEKLPIFERTVLANIDIPPVIMDTVIQTDDEVDIETIVLLIGELKEICMNIHCECSTDNSEVIACIKDVHEDLISRLNILKEKHPDNGEQQMLCLCAWLRMNISTKEHDAYMYSVNPKCPRCALCQRGKHLLNASGSNPETHKELWLAFGTMVQCFETDDDEMLRDVLMNEIPDAVYTKRVDTSKGVHVNSNDIPKATTSYSANGEHFIKAIRDVFHTLIIMGISWGAYRCTSILLHYIKPDVPTIEQPGKSDTKGPRADPVGEKVIYINIVYDNVLHQDAPKKKKQLKDIFEAIRERNIDQFKELLVGVDIRRAREGDINAQPKHAKVFQLLIYLCFQSGEQEGKVDNSFLMMIDHIYKPRIIRQWARLEKVTERNAKHDKNTRYALNVLLLGEEENGFMTTIGYLAKYGTNEVMKRVLENPPFRRQDMDTHTQNCFLVDGLDVIIKELNRRSATQLIGPILNLEPLRSTINDKWECYGRYYIAMMVTYLVFMIIFTLCAAFRPIDMDNPSDVLISPGDSVRTAGELFVLLYLGILIYSTVQDLRVVRRFPRPWLRYELYIYANGVVITSSLIAMALRLLRNENEDIVLAIALLTGWLNFIPRMAAFKRFGMFPVIMHQCVVKDLIPGFLWVFLVALLGLYTATYTVYQIPPVTAEDNGTFIPNDTFIPTPLSLFQMGFGFGDVDYVTESRFQPNGIILYILFVYMVNLVLLNMLISMLGNTYQRVYQIVNQHWIQIKLSYVLLMEMRFPLKKLIYDRLARNPTSRLRGSLKKVGENCFFYVTKLPAAKEEDELYIL